MKTYLVTGAAGFIGTNFVKYMLEKYDKSICLLYTSNWIILNNLKS